MKNKRRNKVERFKKRKFYISYQIQKDGNRISSSMKYEVNRKHVDIKFIENYIKGNTGSANVIILSCFEIGLNDHR